MKISVVVTVTRAVVTSKSQHYGGIFLVEKLEKRDY